MFKNVLRRCLLHPTSPPQAHILEPHHAVSSCKESAYFPPVLWASTIPRITSNSPLSSQSLIPLCDIVTAAAIKGKHFSKRLI